MRLRSQRILRGAVCCAAVLTMSATSASAATFEGRCNLSGTASFADPIGGIPIETNYTFAATAVCAGASLDGGPLPYGGVEVSVTGPGTLSCPTSTNLGRPGDGVLTFPDGRSVNFSLHFASAATEVALAAEGAASGTAVGRATFLQSANQRTLADCALGRLSAVRFSGSIETLTPLEG